MKNIQIVGAGFMGAGIAQVCAQAGCSVELVDKSAENLEKAMAGIKWSVEKLAAKGFLADSPEETLARLKPAHGLAGAAKADLVIEAAFEIESLKLELFKELSDLTGPDVLLATNTSSIPISRIAQAVERPERVLGLHFFGPVPLMPLVEVVKGELTSSEVFEQGMEFCRFLGKTPVKVQKDIPMFVMNRIFGAAFNEAADLVAEGVVTPEDADLGMKMGYGWNVGPFEIVDNAGLDTFLLIRKFMESIGAPVGPGAKMIETMVNEGRLGKKAGQGFYDYDANGRRIAPKK